MKNTEKTEMTDNKESTDIVKVLGRRVRYFRKERKLTQAQLAEKIEKTTEMVCHLENGNALTKLATLQLIADALEVPPADLIQETPDIKKLNIEGERLDIFEMLAEAKDDEVHLVKLLVQKIIQN